MWVVLRRELVAIGRGRICYLLRLLPLAGLVLCMLLANQTWDVRSSTEASRLAAAWFTWVGSVELLVALAAIVLFAAVGLAEHEERRVLPLLLLTPVRPFGVAVAKLLARMALLCVPIVSAGATLCLAALWGGLRPESVFTFHAGLLVLVAFGAALSLWLAVGSSNVAAAIIATATGLAVIWILVPAAVLLGIAAIGPWPGGPPWVPLTAWRIVAMVDLPVLLYGICSGMTPRMPAWVAWQLYAVHLVIAAALVLRTAWLLRRPERIWEPPTVWLRKRRHPIGELLMRCARGPFLMSLARACLVNARDRRNWLARLLIVTFLGAALVNMYTAGTTAGPSGVVLAVVAPVMAYLLAPSLGTAAAGATWSWSLWFLHERLRTEQEVLVIGASIAAWGAILALAGIGGSRSVRRQERDLMRTASFAPAEIAAFELLVSLRAGWPVLTTLVGTTAVGFLRDARTGAVCALVGAETCADLVTASAWGVAASLAFSRRAVVHAVVLALACGTVGGYVASTIASTTVTLTVVTTVASGALIAAFTLRCRFERPAAFLFCIGSTALLAAGVTWLLPQVVPVPSEPGPLYTLWPSSLYRAVPPGRLEIAPGVLLLGVGHAAVAAVACAGAVLVATCADPLWSTAVEAQTRAGVPTCSGKPRAECKA